MIEVVPVPAFDARLYEKSWRPLLERLCSRHDDSVQELADKINSGQVYIFFAIDTEKRDEDADWFVALALMGWIKYRRNGKTVAEITLIAGRDMKYWLPLYEKWESYLRDHEGCDRIRASMRHGWRKILEKRGFTCPSVVMEKELVR